MPVAPKFIAAWLWSWENSSCNTRREVEGWPEQESLCSVWSHHPIPAHQAIFLFHPILILRFFSNGFTFILLSISSSHFFKKMLDEFTPLHFLSPKPDKWEHFLSAKLVYKLLDHSSNPCKDVKKPESRLSFQPEASMACWANWWQQLWEEWICNTGSGCPSPPGSGYNGFCLRNNTISPAR